MSKIPEGATHHCEDPCAVSTGGVRYYKYEQGQWFYWPEAIEPRGVWKECNRPLKPVSAIQPTWNGPEDGLPPVGTVCEVEHAGKWVPCEVIAHFQNEGAPVAVFTFCPYTDKPKVRDCAYYFRHAFRPIRTAEQLAAEEREKAINQMLSISPMGQTASARVLCAMLYDAGARMPGEGSKS